MSQQTALVVDDSKLARITLKRLLEKRGFAVESAESGVQALEMLDEVKPDVIFMDHLMPELDGFETTQKIKADSRHQHIPVIMCSGKEGVDDYEGQARAIGASGTLTKPPQPDKLDAAIKSAMAEEAAAPAPAAPAAAEAPATPATAPAAAPAAAGPDRESIEAWIQQALEPVLGRLNQLESGNETAAANEALEGSVADLGRRVEALESRPEPEAPAALETPDPESLKAEIREDLAAKIEENHSSLESKLETLAGRLDTLESASSETAEAPAAVDEEALAGRVARDVENTLMPMLREEMASARKESEAQMDESLSESRKDLDQHLHEGFKGLEARLSALESQPEAEPAPVSSGMGPDELDARIDERLKHMESATQGPDESELDALRQELAQLRQRLDAVEESRGEAVSEATPTMPEGSSKSGGGAATFLSIIALITAAVALARQFGVF